MSLANKVNDLAQRVGEEIKQVRSEIVGSASGNVFVQPDAPVSAPPSYMWLQTGLGEDGTGMTLWVEDGQ